MAHKSIHSSIDESDTTDGKRSDFIDIRKYGYLDEVIDQKHKPVNINKQILEQYTKRKKFYLFHR